MERRKKDCTTHFAFDDHFRTWQYSGKSVMENKNKETERKKDDEREKKHRKKRENQDLEPKSNPKSPKRNLPFLELKAFRTRENMRDCPKEPIPKEEKKKKKKRDAVALKKEISHVSPPDFRNAWESTELEAMKQHTKRKDKKKKRAEKAKKKTKHDKHKTVKITSVKDFVRSKETGGKAVLIYRRQNQKYLHPHKGKGYRFHHVSFSGNSEKVSEHTEHKKQKEIYVASRKTRLQVDPLQMVSPDIRRTIDMIKQNRGTIDFNKFEEITNSSQLLKKPKFKPHKPLTSNTTTNIVETELESTAEKKLNLHRELIRCDKPVKKKFWDSIDRSLNYRCALAEMFSSQSFLAKESSYFHTSDTPPNRNTNIFVRESVVSSYQVSNGDLPSINSFQGFGRFPTNPQSLTTYTTLLDALVIKENDEEEGEILLRSQEFASKSSTDSISAYHICDDSLAATENLPIMESTLEIDTQLESLMTKLSEEIRKCSSYIRKLEEENSNSNTSQNPASLDWRMTLNPILMYSTTKVKFDSSVPNSEESENEAQKNKTKTDVCSEKTTETPSQEEEQAEPHRSKGVSSIGDDTSSSPQGSKSTCPVHEGNQSSPRKTASKATEPCPPSEDEQTSPRKTVSKATEPCPDQDGQISPRKSTNPFLDDDAQISPEKTASKSNDPPLEGDVVIAPQHTQPKDPPVEENVIIISDKSSSKSTEQKEENEMTTTSTREEKQNSKKNSPKPTGTGAEEKQKKNSAVKWANPQEEEIPNLYFSDDSKKKLLTSTCKMKSWTPIRLDEFTGCEDCNRVKQKILKLQKELQKLEKKISLYPNELQESVKECVEKLHETSDVFLKRLKSCSKLRRKELCKKKRRERTLSAPEPLVYDFQQKPVRLGTSSSDYHINVGLAIKMENVDPATGKKLPPVKNGNFLQEGNVQCRLFQENKKKPLMVMDTGFIYSPEKGMLFGKKDENLTTDVIIPLTVKCSGTGNRTELQYMNLVSEEPNSQNFQKLTSFPVKVEDSVKEGKTSQSKEKKSKPEEGKPRPKTVSFPRKPYSLIPVLKRPPTPTTLKTWASRNLSTSTFTLEDRPVRQLSLLKVGPGQNSILKQIGKTILETSTVEKSCQTSKVNLSEERSNAPPTCHHGIQASLKKRNEKVQTRIYEGGEEKKTHRKSRGEEKQERKMNEVTSMNAAIQVNPHGKHHQKNSIGLQINLPTEEHLRYLKDLEVQKKVNMAIAELCFHLSNENA